MWPAGVRRLDNSGDGVASRNISEGPILRSVCRSALGSRYILPRPDRWLLV